MKNRVKMENTKYFVDSNNKVVICTIDCDMQLNSHPAWDVINMNVWGKRFPNVSFAGDFTVKAKARCREGDIFDEKKGKMIAESKAKAKAYSIASRIYKSLHKYLIHQAMMCFRSYDACFTAETVEREHVKELSI